MVCGLGCLAPNGGRLDEVLRQPCNTLGDPKKTQNIVLTNSRHGQPEGTRPLSDLLVSCGDGFHFQVG